LGCDASDVQVTVRRVLDKGVSVEAQGLGRIAPGVCELILAVLAQVGDMEHQRIPERTDAGRKERGGPLPPRATRHRGKASIRRPKVHDPQVVAVAGNARGQHHCDGAALQLLAGHGQAGVPRLRVNVFPGA
jgi:putative DNA-invertase from lambdoid prophage Rac